MAWSRTCRTAQGALLRRAPPAPRRADADRGHPRRGVDGRPCWTDGGADVRRDRLHHLRGREGCRPGPAHRAPGQAHPGSQLALFTLDDFYVVHHRPGRRTSSRSRPLSPPCRRRQNSIRDRSGGRRPQAPAVGTVRRQRRAAWRSRRRPATCHGGRRASVCVTASSRRRRLPSAARSGSSGGSPARARRTVLHLPARWPRAAPYLDGLARVRALPHRGLTRPGPGSAAAQRPRRGIPGTTAGITRTALRDPPPGVHGAIRDTDRHASAPAVPRRRDHSAHARSHQRNGGSGLRWALPT